MCRWLPTWPRLVSCFSIFLGDDWTRYWSLFMIQLKPRSMSLRLLKMYPKVFLVRSLITHLSARHYMCRCVRVYPIVSTHFFLHFCDEISLCTRPSSLSFCDEKYPGCPFYAWTPWLLFLFSLPFLLNMLMPIPRSRISGVPVRDLNHTTVLHDNLRRNSWLVSGKPFCNHLVLTLTQTINRNRQSVFTGLLQGIGWLSRIHSPQNNDRGQNASPTLNQPNSNCWDQSGTLKEEQYSIRYNYLLPVFLLHFAAFKYPFLSHLSFSMMLPFLERPSGLPIIYRPYSFRLAARVIC
jgi:hypothetical protein